MRKWLLAVLFAPALAAAGNIEPGNWEFTVNVWPSITGVAHGGDEPACHGRTASSG